MRRIHFCWIFVLALLPATIPLLQAAEPGADNPRSEYWRAVRQSEQGYSAVRGPESNVLINGQGQNWRQLRNGPIADYGGWLLAVVFVLLLLLSAVRGSIKLEQGRSGETIPRWSRAKRINHWVMAGCFILLALSGLLLLFGKVALIPWLGKATFSSIAYGGKLLHNYIGPVFSVALFLFLLPLIKHNMFTRVDMQWFGQGGGFIPGRHPSAGRMNGGEKVLFWLLFFGGLAVVISGLVLDFPNFGQLRETMQNYHLIHATVSLLLVVIIMGHIYIAIATQGALEGMVRGEVDANWARQHHDLWYQQQQGTGDRGD